MGCKVFRRAELAAIDAIRADKVGIAKPADGFFAVTLKARPQVASGKSQENGRPARLRAFALKRVIGLLDGPGHAPAFQRCQPLERSSQAGHVPQP